MAWDPISDVELIPGGNALKHMKQLWNNLKWLYGNLGSVIVSGVQNGSFEVDADGGGVPDGWTFTPYAGGSCAIDTATPSHGAAAVKIVHPGGVGNGGGTLASDYVPCDELVQQFLGFIHWASAAGMKNRVQVKYYDKGKVALSTATIYESTANPASATYFICGFTPPAGTRYYKAQVVGGVDDTNVAGTAYFDGIREARTELFKGQTLAAAAIAEVTSASSVWADASSITIQMPLGNIPVVLTFTADLHCSINVGADQRFRIGSAYSNEVSSVSNTYATNTFTISYTPTQSGAVSLIMQLKRSGGDTAYGRKPGTTAALRFDHATL